jgi:hypothetical protein
MFARINREDENKEVLINLNRISTIEMSYGISDDGTNFTQVSLRRGASDPTAVRMYKFMIEGKPFSFAARNPDDPLTKALGKIYNDVLKGPTKLPAG